MREYQALVRQVIADGEPRADRTGVGTVSLFGTQTRIDLRQGFPVLTSKRMRWRNAIREMLWFLRGETNTSTLGCRIWDAWADSTGECGPIYGAQWRREPEQIRTLIDGIKTDPGSRRHVVSAWNPSDLDRMALPPCHVLFQCFVGGISAVYPNRQWLDLHLYQRSADLALGVPFNWIGYATLLELLARECTLTARYLIHSIGDAHVYTTHMDGLRRQLEREPREMPRLVLPSDLSMGDLMEGSERDASRFGLIGYNPHGPIRYAIAV